MPIKVQHERDGELIPYRWSWWHLGVFREIHETSEEGRILEAVIYEDPNDPNHHIYVKPGDIVRIFR